MRWEWEFDMFTHWKDAYTYCPKRFSVLKISDMVAWNFQVKELLL
jgi:hypothetical protein